MLGLLQGALGRHTGAVERATTLIGRNVNKPLKGTVIQFIFFLKSGHYGAIDLRNNGHILKYFCKK